MKGKKLLHKTAGMAAALLSLSLFSCSSDGTLDSFGKSQTDCIRFGISDADNATRANGNGEDVTSTSYVLRSDETTDTLCVRAIVSDGIEANNKQHATRASMLTGMYDKFKVVAQVKNADGTFGTQYYMDDVATKKGSLWQSANIYYWPGNRQLNFLAWAPADNGVFTETPVYPAPDVKKTTIKYTVPDDALKQPDIMAAYTGYMSNPGTGSTCAPVNLQFKHLCTAVRILTGAEMTNGSIQSVKITNVHKSGTYDMATSKWTLDGETTDYSIAPNYTTTTTTPNGTILYNGEAAFMLLPQILGKDSKLEVVYKDKNSGKERTISASLNGAEWPMGKTVTYRLSISPYYELEFTEDPGLQDAHYVICPIKIRSKYLENGWTLTSKSPKVTLCKELTDLTSLGYWVEEDRGTLSISGKGDGEVTVYAFLEENIDRANRKVDLELKPKDYPKQAPVVYTLEQLFPSWNTEGLGCERLEDKVSPWGFLWDNDMKITYDMSDAGGHGILGPIRRWIMKLQIKYYGDKYQDYITYTTYWAQLKSLTIDFSKVPKLDVSDDPDDGNKNTWELYNFNGISDVTGLMKQLEDWGGKPDKKLPIDPAEYAARMCILKNKFNKEKIGSEGGTTAYRPVLKRENLVWYLPSKNEYTKMKDNDYPLSGEYWTSTASDVAHDNENAYQYTEGVGTKLRERTANLKHRAMRKMPGTK